jgi:nicotinate-nucleotide pyrophosphorylase
MHDAQLKNMIHLALQEDRVLEDWTSHSCFPPSALARAEIRLKEAATIAGLLPKQFEELDPRVQSCFMSKKTVRCEDAPRYS